MNYSYGTTNLNVLLHQMNLGNSAINRKIDRGESLTEEEMKQVDQKISELVEHNDTFKSFFKGVSGQTPSKKLARFRELKYTFKAGLKEDKKADAVYHRARPHAKREIEKMRQPENQQQIAAQLFNINPVPQIKGEMQQLVYVNKIAFIAENFPLDKISEISSKAKRYPIMKEAVKKIKENLKIWDALEANGDSIELEKLQKTLKQQLKNLEEFSNILSEVVLYDQDKNALAMLSLNQLRTEFQMVQKTETQHELERKNVEEVRDTGFDAFFDGSADLTKEKTDVIVKLKQDIEKIKAEEFSPVSRETLERKRRRSPVTGRAIVNQAELHQAIRRGKAWAFEQPQLVAQGTSVNQVFKLFNPDVVTQTISYFKVGDRNEKAAGTMEKLMWDAAVVMGLEDRFVPTGETAVTTQTQYLRGGIQVAQKGLTLEEYSNNPQPGNKPLNRQDVASAAMASVLFGMFDAHSINIFVTNDGQIKFFDNTRSLPTTNGFIQRGGIRGACSSYRCGLMTLDMARESLTQTEVKQLRAEVLAYKAKYQKLKSYLNSPEVQKRIEKLPPGWLDLKSSLAAMEERMNLLETALATPGEKSIEQIVIQSIPQYKFAFVVTYLGRVADKPYSGLLEDVLLYSEIAALHEYMHYYSADQVLRFAGTQGFDVDEIKQWCEDPSLSLPEIVDKIQIKNSEIKAMEPNLLQEAIDNATIAAEEMIVQIHSEAGVDFKDHHYSRSVLYMNLKHIEDLGVKIIASSGGLAANIQEACQYAEREGLSNLLFIDANYYNLIVKTETTYKVLHVEIDRKDGEASVAGLRLPIKHIFGEDFISFQENVVNLVHDPHYGLIRDTVENAKQYARINGKANLLVLDGTELTYIHYEEQGDDSWDYSSKKIELLNDQGLIKVDGESLPLEDFLKSLEEIHYPPAVHNVAALRDKGIPFYEVEFNAAIRFGLEHQIPTFLVKYGEAYILYNYEMVNGSWMYSYKIVDVHSEEGKFIIEGDSVTMDDYLQSLEVASPDDFPLARNLRALLEKGAPLYQGNLRDAILDCLAKGIPRFIFKDRGRYVLYDYVHSRVGRDYEEFNIEFSQEYGFIYSNGERKTIEDFLDSLGDPDYEIAMLDALNRKDILNYSYPLLLDQIKRISLIGGFSSFIHELTGNYKLWNVERKSDGSLEYNSREFKILDQPGKIEVKGEILDIDSFIKGLNTIPSSEFPVNLNFNEFRSYGIPHFIDGINLALEKALKAGASQFLVQDINHFKLISYKGDMNFSVIEIDDIYSQPGMVKIKGQKEQSIEDLIESLEEPQTPPLVDNLLQLGEQGINFENRDINSAIQEMHLGGVNEKYIKDGDNYYLIYNTPTGYRTASLNPAYKEGKVGLGNRWIPIENFAASIAEHSGDQYVLEDIPSITPETLSHTLLLKNQGEIAPRLSEYGRTLIIGRQEENGVNEYLFDPCYMKPGFFMWGNEEVSLEEIFNRMKPPRD